MGHACYMYYCCPAGEKADCGYDADIGGPERSVYTHSHNEQGTRFHIRAY